MSYNRFVELLQRIVFPMAMLSKISGLKQCDGVLFIDSFPLKACHIKRASSHKVFFHI